MIRRIILGLICPISLLLAGFIGLKAAPPEDAQSVPTVDSIDSSFITANTRFGFSLFNEIRKTKQNQNIVISPLSISVALAMTRNGASGETEQATIKTLKFQNLSSETINANYLRLRQALQAPRGVTLTIANSLWARQGVQFKPDFLQQNHQFFGTEISALDFKDPDTPTAINRWVNTNTNGKIPKVMDEVNADAVLLLISTIYFKGTWTEKFDSSDTRERSFYLTSGEKKQVPMMGISEQYLHYREKGFQAIRLPYRSGYMNMPPYSEGQMSMYIFLPDPESELMTFLDSLNTEDWENWMAHFRLREVNLLIPKFKFECKTRLNDALSTLGMKIAFDQEFADFDHMATPEESKFPNFYIQDLSHAALIEVNEAGTEAAAVTRGVMLGRASLSEPPINFIVDRPFLFAIRHDNTKTVLFMGIVVDP